MNQQMDFIFCGGGHLPSLNFDSNRWKDGCHRSEGENLFSQMAPISSCENVTGADKHMPIGCLHSAKTRPPVWTSSREGMNTMTARLEKNPVLEMLREASLLRTKNSTHKGLLQGRKSPESCGRRNSSSVIKPSSVHHGSGQQTNSSPSTRLQGNGCSTGEPRRLDRALSEPADRKIAQSNSSRYKTELCRPFEENGTCKYGDKCQFAHGVKELRTLARHPKYKTELCRTFHSLGLCPYGPRCHFIHNSEQTKQSLITNLAVNPNHSNPNAGRPKALSSSSLGSTGEVSPPSSHGGSPTLMKSFDDLFQMQTPMSPNLNGNTAFSFSQDFATIVNPMKNTPSLSFGGMSHAARALFELPVSNPEIYNLALYQDTVASSVFACSPSSPVDNTSDLDCLNLGGSAPVPIPFSQSSKSPPALNSPLDVNNQFGRLAFFSNLGSQE